MKKLWLICILCFTAQIQTGAQDFKIPHNKNAALYPQQNQFRNVLDLSGIWRFQKDDDDKGETEQWYTGLKSSEQIAVPGSWNEQIEGIRDYMGIVWYEQNVFVPQGWSGQRVFIRFGSVQYAAKVWVNGIAVGMHEGGSLPFAMEITPMISRNSKNRISVRVENILKPTRIPVGGLPPGGMFSNNPPSSFDFFPYGGIQRPVWLYTIPKNAIKDITVQTTLNTADGVVTVKVEKEGTAKQAKITLEGNKEKLETKGSFTNNVAMMEIKVPAARLWSPDDPFLYHLTVTLINGKDTQDEYELPIGIRTIAVNENQILLNGKPIILKGFGKHEDFPVLGKGTSYPVIVKDFSLLKWIGANSFRTSHYPYDEAFMEMADREGILVIDEIPAVGLYFDDNREQISEREAACIRDIKELVNRDKNHPSVIMWSLANEPIASNRNFRLAGKATADSISL
ncbi:MAG TPA: glycoside hydrolase family 2 TIM barrel-domain containing protein, partial [Agriterribacter sp.]|nr:glycoside hydrolase family 2 TIM barrel-domain containing protein [Agriterribacter sp.]